MLLSCERDICAEAWLQHLRALDLWENAENYTAAAAASRAADAVFGTRLSPVNAARVVLQTTLDRIEGRTEAASQRLNLWRSYVRARHYWAIAGRIEWQTALLTSEAGFLGPAIPIYLSAGNFFRRARDREGEAVVSALVAQLYQLLDDPDRAWQHEFAALRGLPFARPIRRVPILSLAAILSTASNLDGAAVSFRAPLIREAAAAKSPGRLANRLAE